MLENYFISSYWRDVVMSDIKKELLAPCGLYCGVCRIYKAHKDNDLEFKKEILPSLREFGAKAVDDIACTGCLSDDVVFCFCQTCPIKDCVKNKGIESCSQCKDFPCKIITNWPDPMDKKIMLRSIPQWRKLGTEKWVKEEEKRYYCSTCGYQLYHGAKRCRKCGKIVEID